MYFHWRNERASRLKLTLLRVTVRITTGPKRARVPCLRVRNSQAERKKALLNNGLPRDSYLFVDLRFLVGYRVEGPVCIWIC